MQRFLRPGAALCRGLSGSASDPGLCFRLDPSFVDRYRSQRDPFGFDGLGEIVYRRTYSRVKSDGASERWVDTVQRVVEGTYSVQRAHADAEGLPWDGAERQSQSQRMFDRIFRMQFVPSGRGLWSMGTPLIHSRGLHAALNNCAFVSTESMSTDPIDPFTFLFDCSLLGVGVGYDTEGGGRARVYAPSDSSAACAPFVIPDSREGWVESLRRQLSSYLLPGGGPRVRFDYSEIRPAGAPIRTLGGVASGAGPLRELHARVDGQLGKVLSGGDGCLSSRGIVDLQNAIGCCVSGSNVRRTAQLALGRASDCDFQKLKDYSVHPERREIGWVSNNSVKADLGMDYGSLARQMRVNGEPGVCWLENMQEYGRLYDGRDGRDRRVRGGNPCLEQSLESHEVCCLVETFPIRHASLCDFESTLDLALEYAKTVTLLETHWPTTNAILRRNRRIGCSVSGVADFVCARGVGELRDWLTRGYARLRARDRALSCAWRVPESVKLTSVKPSGTVSLLAGTCSGMHYPESAHYLRRLSFARDSPLLRELESRGFPVESSVQDEYSSVVSVPVRSSVSRSVRDQSMWEQLGLASLLQRYWADNQVSCTVSFDSAREGPDLSRALDYYQYQLKSVSFLPRCVDSVGAYPQMPFEPISAGEYARLRGGIRASASPSSSSCSRDACVEEESSPSGVGIGLPRDLQFCTNDGCL